MKETALGVDLKGRGGLVVERAEPREAAGPRRTQRDGLADDLDDVVRLPDLLPECLPSGHRSSILPAMNDESLRRLLDGVASGEVTPEEAARQLRFPFETIGEDGKTPFARLDHHRELRRGFPEVVLAEGKSAEQVVEIVRALRETAGQTLVTRAAPETARAVREAVPDAVWHAEARAVVVSRTLPAPTGARIGVVSAGTSDIPVAEEAALTAELMGAEVRRTFDIGVAGIQRLLAEASHFRSLHAMVVVAGMEAALAPVVAGLAPCPIVAVPTSTGYGRVVGRAHGAAVPAQQLRPGGHCGQHRQRVRRRLRRGAGGGALPPARIGRRASVRRLTGPAEDEGGERHGQVFRDPDPGGGASSRAPAGWSSRRDS